MPVDAAQPVSTPRRTPCTQQFAQSTHPTSAASSSFEHLLLLPPFSLCTHITSILPSPPPPRRRRPTPSLNDVDLEQKWLNDVVRRMSSNLGKPDGRSGRPRADGRSGPARHDDPEPLSFQPQWHLPVRTPMAPFVVLGRR
ncbi:hypothetical protein ACFX15_004664 [Malus domestica]